VPAFFKIGLTTADLKAKGTTPDKKEDFLPRVMDGHMQWMIEQRRVT